MTWMASSSGVGQLGSSPPNSLALCRLLVQVGGIVEKNCVEVRRTTKKKQKTALHISLAIPIAAPSTPTPKKEKTKE